MVWHLPSCIDRAVNGNGFVYLTWTREAYYKINQIEFFTIIIVIIITNIITIIISIQQHLPS